MWPGNLGQNCRNDLSQTKYVKNLLAGNKMVVGNDPACGFLSIAAKTSSRRDGPLGLHFVLGEGSLELRQLHAA
jgi:hypothetical protein